MNSLIEAQHHIDSISRPNGYNMYAWNTAKRMALEAWEFYLHNRPFRKPVNYFCQEFYQMLRLPNGNYIIPEHTFRRYN